VTVQEVAEVPQNTALLVNQTNSLNIYNYIVNALQGGANEADPHRDFENRTEFKV
jgi:hypothetical protein